MKPKNLLYLPILIVVAIFDFKDELTCEIRNVMQLVRDATVSILDKTSLEAALHSKFSSLKSIVETTVF
jgi:DNA-binding IscR family transcriptional regulator